MAVLGGTSAHPERNRWSQTLAGWEGNDMSKSYSRLSRVRATTFFSLLLAALLLAVTAAVAPGVPSGLAEAQSSTSTDRDALVALYNGTNGPNWANSTNWLSNRPLSEWHGVTTDASGHVTELNLYGNQLTGAIPSSLGNLSNLTVLNLHNNELTGAIPSSLGNLSNLTVWKLDGNHLTGAIPSSLGNLSNLTVLGLSGNQLTGEIPAELGNLASLGFLYLAGNPLTGCVPVSLRNVASNDFPELGLPFCDMFDPGGVAGDRDALVALYNATDGLNWTNNSRWLTDAPIGQWHGVTTAAAGRVTHLDLQYNGLTGRIPPELGSLSILAELLLERNKLTGSIPSELGSLSNLTVLGLSGNQLTGLTGCHYDSQ